MRTGWVEKRSERATTTLEGSVRDELGSSVMVAQEPLELYVQVRILAPQRCWVSQDSWFGSAFGLAHHDPGRAKRVEGSKA